MPSVTCSYQQQGFCEIWHDKTQHCQFYCAEESFLLSFPVPDEFLSLDSSLLADLKAPPVQSVDVQPMTCTGFLVFPQEVRVVLLECAAKATISAHFYHCTAYCHPCTQSQQESFSPKAFICIKNVYATLTSSLLHN